MLNNWRKHREDRGDRSRTWTIDPYATGWAFDGWKEHENEPFVWKLPDEYNPGVEAEELAAAHGMAQVRTDSRARGAEFWIA